MTETRFLAHASSSSRGSPPDHWTKKMRLKACGKSEQSAIAKASLTMRRLFRMLLPRPTAGEPTYRGRQRRNRRTGRSRHGTSPWGEGIVSAAPCDESLGLRTIEIRSVELARGEQHVARQREPQTRGTDSSALVPLQLHILAVISHGELAPESPRGGTQSLLRQDDAEVEVDDLHAHAQLQAQLRARGPGCEQPPVTSTTMRRPWNRIAVKRGPLHTGQTVSQSLSL